MPIILLKPLYRFRQTRVDEPIVEPWNGFVSGEVARLTEAEEVLMTDATLSRYFLSIWLLGMTRWS